MKFRCPFRCRRDILFTGLLLLLTTIAALGLFYAIQRGYRQSTADHQTDLIRKYQDEYQLITLGYRLLSRQYYQQVVEDIRVAEILHDANLSSEQDREILREELQTRMTPIYSDMMDVYFRQFHFALQDNTSFLRMHMPDRYGDDLSDVRASVALSNRDQQYVEGFEEGRVFNGYRYQYPIAYGGEHVGTVEISLSLASITAIMRESFQRPSLFIMDREVMDLKVWEDLQSDHYIPIPLSDQYVLDNETMQDMTDAGVHSLMVQPQHQTALRTLLDSRTDFVYPFTVGRQAYSGVFIAIDNILDQHVAYLIFVQPDSVTKGYVMAFRELVIAIILVYLLAVGMMILQFRSHRRLERVSYHDKLTGLYNRNLMFDFLEREISRGNRHGVPFSLIMFDVDKFKDINDQRGHLAGDQLLREIARQVSLSIRQEDMAIRYGGDEFLVILPGTTAEDAQMIARRIAAHVAKEELTADITLSMGVTDYLRDEDATTLLHRADHLLYTAKAQGRNRVVAEVDEDTRAE